MGLSAVVQLCFQQEYRVFRRVYSCSQEYRVVSINYLIVSRSNALSAEVLGFPAEV